MRQQPDPGIGEEYQDDMELVELAREGDLQAFDQLVLKYQDLIYAYSCRMLRNPETAREITQDIFLRAYRYLKGFRGDSKFSTWLFTIASSTCKNALSYYGLRARHAAEIHKGEDEEGNSTSLMDRIPDTTFSPDVEAERAEQIAMVRKSIEELPENFRQVVSLKDINGFAYEEIAEIIGCKVGTVKSRLARARIMLRENLIKAGVMPEGA